MNTYNKISSVSVAAIFSDGCVLQRNKNICIFGSSDCGDRIKVSAELLDYGNRLLASNHCYTDKGKWQLHLKAQEAQENVKLKILCSGESKTFSDISIGEVWLAGGQSNMEYELANCTEGPSEIENEINPNVRFYYTQKNSWIDEKFIEDENKTHWEVWQNNAEGRKKWSAVGYFFAKKLSAELKVTVGVIGCNWGGSSASTWVPVEDLEKDSDLKTYISDFKKEYEIQCGGKITKSIEEQCTEYDEYIKFHEQWQKKCDELYKVNPAISWDDVQKKIGKCAWPGPKNCKNPFRPSGLYTCMLKRIIPYTLKGFIYYQGESDDHKSRMYTKLFGTLIGRWRKDWNDCTLPFIFVQLPENRYIQDRDSKNWCGIRSAQHKIFAATKNTAMINALGLGAYNDIHPKHKKVLAERMCNAALNVAYGFTEKYPDEKIYGPAAKSSLPCKDKIEIEFDYARGLIFRKDETRLEQYISMEKNQGNIIEKDFTGFEVAGYDKIFYPAEIEITGENTVRLKSKKVDEPVYARYAWYNYGPVTLFAENGLSASPFNTLQEE